MTLGCMIYVLNWKFVRLQSLLKILWLISLTVAKVNYVGKGLTSFSFLVIMIPPTPAERERGMKGEEGGGGRGRCFEGRKPDKHGEQPSGSRKKIGFQQALYRNTKLCVLDVQ